MGLSALKMYIVELGETKEEEVVPTFVWWTKSCNFSLRLRVSYYSTRKSRNNVLIIQETFQASEE
jgi:hypothetical protein